MGVIAGDYTVAFDPTTFSPGTAPTTPVSVDVTLAVGDENLAVDLGLDGTNTIGDTVFFDTNRNGAEDAGELGEGGITLVLLDDAGNEVGRTVTQPDGSYSFDDIPGGDYTVVAPAADLPVGYELTTPGADGLGLPGHRGGQRRHRHRRPRRVVAGRTLGHRLRRRGQQCRP